ncbi:MAG TPA: VanZ family protein [Clostridia bacterium]|nr:VanZ family protein [Clostridia bacterium]
MIEVNDKSRKKRVIPRGIAVALPVLWTSFIFYNSLQTASRSLEQSGFFVDLFTNMTRLLYKGAIPQKLLGYIELRLVDDIRSLAHIFEFFVLYLLCYIAFASLAKIRRNMSAAFAYGLVIVLMDETIQIFVDGRGFQIKDILLDCSGMLIAFLGILLVIYLRTGKSKEIRDESGE